MNFFIEQHSDLIDAFRELKDKPYPYHISVSDGVNKHQSWKQLNSFFHAGIVPLFSDKTGYNKREAKEELQKMHALVYEDETSYEVESIANMSYGRLVEFVNACQNTLVTQFGVMAQADENIKTKVISK